MERLKKILASALLVCMLVSMLPVGALAEGCAHNYVMTVTANPGCTSVGSASYTCSACGNTYNAEIPATGHSHQVTATTAPTCAAAGSTTYTCSHCGDSYGTEIPALGHSYAPATCTAPKTCAVCGATEGAALEHTPGEPVTVAASCTAEGSTTVSCTGCGGVLSTTVIPAGHSFSDANCTAPKTCGVCGATEGEALGHDYVGAVTKEAACAEAGEMTYTCSRCLDGYTEIVTATGHSYENGVCGVCGAQCAHEGFMNATCTAPKTCAICHLTEGESLGHDFTDATCTAPKTCGRCEATEGEPLGHTAGEETVITEATCIAEGSKSVNCTVCGETYTAIIPATGVHSEGAHTVTKEATCEEPGEETISCATEGCEYSETMEIPALGHKYNEQHECSVCGEKEPLLTMTPPKNVGFTIYGDSAINIGAKTKLDANATVTWTSSDSAIAEVNEYGEVTGNEGGNVTITATDGNNIAYHKIHVHKYSSTDWESNIVSHWRPCTVNNCPTADSPANTEQHAFDVSGGPDECKCGRQKPPASISSFAVGPMRVGDTKQLSIGYPPENASITWSSSDTDIATVDSNGLITGVAPGDVVITANVNGNELTYSQKVLAQGASEVKATAINISAPSGTTVYAGETLQLAATLTPQDSTDQILWTSGDYQIANIGSNDGIVRGIKAGKVMITAATGLGTEVKTDTIEITVLQPVTAITITGGTEVEKDGLLALTATVEPTDASNKNVVWASSDTSVATVSDTGVVAGRTSGTTTITATAADGKGAVGTATITVTPIKVKKIEVSGANEINVGDETTFSATVLPSTAGNNAVKWSSSDPTVATVDEDTGEVTGMTKGHAVITATAQDGSNIKGSLQVYVIGSEAYEKAYIYAENHIVYVGETVKVHFVPPSDVKKITSASWSIAGVSDGTGTIVGNLTEATVTGGSVGTLDISVQITGTKNDSGTYIGTITSAHIITVKAADEKPEPVPVTGIAIEGSERVLAGKSIPLTAKVTPEYADDTTVTWSIDKPEFATVDTNGVVTGIKAGTVTVKATANDESGVYATHSVTVDEIAVSIDGASTVLTGGTITLSAVVTPAYATDKTVTWTSTDDTIATVDENGVVTGKKTDKVTITATSNADPTKFASKEITVTAPSLTVSGPGAVAVGKTITLTAKVSPDEVKDKTVTWTSSDETIATVDKDGKVTGKKVGDVKITATSNAYKNLTVEVPVKVTAAVYLYYGNGSHFNGIHPLPFVSSDLWAGGAGVSVIINGVPLVPGRDFSCYSSPSGMIGVTVHPGMLRLLPQNAWHTIDIVSANGVASGYFSTGYFGYYNINGVKTGDDSNPLLWAALCLLGISGAGMILVKSRKRKA